MIYALIKRENPHVVLLRGYVDVDFEKDQFAWAKSTGPMQADIKCKACGDSVRGRFAYWPIGRDSSTYRLCVKCVDGAEEGGYFGKDT